MNELETGVEETLSDEAQAYFESRGEKLPEQETREVPNEEEAKAETEADSEAEADELLDDADEKPKGDKTVPLRAVTKEREERKLAQRALQDLQTKYAVLEDRWNTILKMQQPEPEKSADDDPEPDPNDDIFAHNAWLKRQVDKVRDERAQEANERAKQTEEQRVEQQIWGYWEQDAQQYTQKNPDFQNAAKWLAEYRDKQLTALSVADQRFQDVRARNWQIEQELKQIVVSAAQRQMSPAELVYQIAQGYGYRQTAKQADDPAKAVESLKQKIETETSLSDAGGSSTKGSLSPEDIANMSPGEFEAWYSKHGEKGFRRIAGRSS